MSNMAVRRLTRVLQDIRKATLHEAAASSDGQLLGQFVEQHDDAAFAALVKRHSGMVWGVCRRVLAHHHDAEDAFQATFLVLARKAASVRPRHMVANWLHGVARRTALKAMTMAGKRRRREKQVIAMPEPQTGPPRPWPDLESIIDQELAALPDKYRIVLLLCDLEGKTGREAARQLDIPEGTLAGRLRTGRLMLAKRLARHGLVFSGGALAAVLSQHAAAAAPTAIVSMTIEAATLVAAGKTAAGSMISAKVAALTEGVLQAMFLTKLKQAMGVVLLLTLISLGGVVGTHDTAIGQPAATAEAREVPPPARKTPREPAKEAAAPRTDKERLQGIWTVVSMEMNGKRVATGKMVFMIDGNRACWQTSEAEIHGGFYLDATTDPKSYDLATTARTFEGIYDIDGESLRLCYVAGDERKRPDRFEAAAGSERVLVTLKRKYHGKDVFPFRLADGSRAFPRVVEPAKNANPPPPPVVQASPPMRAEPVKYVTPNFVVFANGEGVARAVGERAEAERQRLGKQWLGQAPPHWKQPCLIHVSVPKGKKANGFASFAYEENRRFAPRQEVWLQAPKVQDLMPDVLPQQVMHTLLAHELGANHPRWIESGAGCMVQSDEAKKDRLATLAKALADGKTMPLAKLFALRDYPDGDLNVWYSQCLSVCQFLVERKDRAALLAFVQRGSERGWDEAARRYYGFADIIELDVAWRKSVQDAKGAEKQAPAPRPQASTARVVYNVADLVVPIPCLDDGDGAKTKERWLIEKITRTIAPQSWQDQGGAGSIEYYPMGLALVVKQAPEIQTRVNQLLESLRRFQDIQIAIETRIVTIRKDSLPKLRNVIAGLKADGHVILNEAEAFALLEKAKADKCSLLQTPKVTIFPGQRMEVGTEDVTMKYSALVAANLHHVELDVKAKAGKVEWTKSVRLASDATLVLAADAGGGDMKLLLVTPRVLIDLEETASEKVNR
jgi:RNA polymerase sigma factor (sigma-70 family)